MNAWQEEQRARLELLNTTAAAIAAELDGWEYVAPEESGAGHLVNTDGVRVWVSIGTYGAGSGRLTLSAATPDGADYSAGDYGRYADAPRPEITVNPARPAATLARDVARRILPAAVDYWGMVTARIAERVARANVRESAARELAEILGTRVNGPGRHGEWSASVYWPGRTHMVGDMVADHDGTADVKVSSVPIAAAREIAAILARYAADETGAGQ